MNESTEATKHTTGSAIISSKSNKNKKNMKSPSPMNSYSKLLKRYGADSGSSSLTRTSCSWGYLTPQDEIVQEDDDVIIEEITETTSTVSNAADETDLIQFQSIIFKSVPEGENEDKINQYYDESVNSENERAPSIKVIENVLVPRIEVNNSKTKLDGECVTIYDDLLDSGISVKKNNKKKLQAKLDCVDSHSKKLANELELEVNTKEKSTKRNKKAANTKINPGVKEDEVGMCNDLKAIANDHTLVNKKSTVQKSISSAKKQRDVGLTREEKSSSCEKHEESPRKPQSDADSAKKKRTPGKRRDRERNLYEPYWSHKDVMDGLKRGQLIQGPLRINPKHYQDSYIPSKNETQDIYISGMRNRNRSLNGDIVSVVINPKEEWKVMDDDFKNELDKVPLDFQQLALSPHGTKDNKGDIVKNDGTTPQKNENKGNDKAYLSLGDYLKMRVKSTSSFPMMVEKFPEKYLQKTGKVVCIVEKKHSRACTGYIRKMADGNQDRVLFSPIDPRLPRLTVPMKDCPKGFAERPEDYETTLFIARISAWSETSKFASGTLARSLGKAGQIEPETEGILIENGVDYSEFPLEALACLPQTPWSIPQVEYGKRKDFDFRKECLFTIDPATARDLDDAVHCNSLGGGVYEIGVHIADVSFFLEAKTPLDIMAGNRATSVYLVQKVIPMLPRLLCEQLCSLNPDKDRLSFSVVWHINQHGDILEEKFGRSIIRSCVKLSYQHAQGFIEQPTRQWTNEELPPISEGFSIEDIKSRVLILDKIAKNLRKKRFDNGALRLDQVKLQYSLDPESGLPNGYSVYQQKDSNKLIEEFMLLANMAVAHKIYKTFPAIAVLRRHPSPQKKMVDDLVELCNNMGLPIDASNSGTLQRSLVALCSGDDYESKAKMQILTVLCSKPMQTARYFCTGCLDDEAEFHHYALNVPLYTHFTSPIRRYADVMVHRLLAAALGYNEPPVGSSIDFQHRSSNCNDKKNASKIVQELSSDMFFAIFVKECGPLEEHGMVMGVMDHSFDVLILKLGVVKRIYTDKLPLASSLFTKNHKKPELALSWAITDMHHTEVVQTITIFTPVNCVLKAEDKALKWSATIRHPNDQPNFATVNKEVEE